MSESSAGETVVLIHGLWMTPRSWEKWVGRVEAQDHVSPPAITKATRKIYAKSHSTTDMRQYPGKTHWIAGQPGWEEVADYVLEWAIAHHAAPKAVA